MIKAQLKSDTFSPYAFSEFVLMHDQRDCIKQGQKILLMRKLHSLNKLTVTKLYFY